MVGNLTHQSALLGRFGEAERSPQRSHQAVRPVLLGVAGAQDVERAPAHRGRKIGRAEHVLGHRTHAAVVGQAVVGQDAFDLVQRLFGLAQLVHAQGGQAQACLVGLVPRQKRQPNAQHIDQGLPKALSFEESFQGRGDLGGSGCGAKQRLQVADGPFRRSRVAGDRGRLLQEAVAPGAFGGTRERLIIGGKHLVPALLDREQDGDALDRPVGIRVRRQNLAQKLDRPIGLAGVPFLEKAQSPLSERAHPLAVEARLEHLAIERGHLVGLLLLARQRFRLIPSRWVGRLCLGCGKRCLQLVPRGLVLVSPGLVLFGRSLVRIITSRT